MALSAYNYSQQNVLKVSRGRSPLPAPLIVGGFSKNAPSPRFELSPIRPFMGLAPSPMGSYKPNAYANKGSTNGTATSSGPNASASAAADGEKTK